MDLIQLYQYFSKFVPVDVLGRNHAAGFTPDKGAAAVQAETLAIESTHRISNINDYLFLGDQSFVLERLRNSKDLLFFVDSDRIDYTPDTDGGVRLSIGLTIAEHYNHSNASVVSELTAQNRCLETLKTILRTIISDEESQCPGCLNISQPVEIRFFDAKELNGLIGYTAFFTINSCEYELA